MSRVFSRRKWLLSTSGAFAAASLGTAQEYRIEGADFKLGVASYSFRKFSREQAIQMTKELGTPYLNVKDYHLALTSTSEEIDTARKQFADAGIIIVGCGNISFPTEDEADIRRKFEYAQRLGSPLIVCAPTHASLPKLEKFVRQYNIKIAVHNHGPEDKHFPTPQSVLEAVRGMDPRC
ncbi:MAG: sugar phosphate isomerase/epimerase, partial [Acidobacteriaceae bacterium]|nr:sugar phosphate isomerase/epimerase [Acidobacteriaceae bacterium]